MLLLVQLLLNVVADAFAVAAGSLLLNALLQSFKPLAMIKYGQPRRWHFVFHSFFCLMYSCGFICEVSTVHNDEACYSTVLLRCRLVRDHTDFHNFEREVQKETISKQEEMGVTQVVGILRVALEAAVNKLQKMEDKARRAEHHADVNIKDSQDAMKEWLIR